jgi:hypothetical protein
MGLVAPIVLTLRKVRNPRKSLPPKAKVAIRKGANLKIKRRKSQKILMNLIKSLRPIPRNLPNLMMKRSKQAKILNRRRCM